ncbi:hypothetical protein [Roseibium sp.]|uniref:hypothetical protein n=1 Tax=Roseibium sp. TaxID=1936156 RepID=UPI003264309F
MGKRSNFIKVPKDLYRTIDPRACPPVLPFVLSEGIRRFIEPCYGYGDLPGPFLRAGLDCVGRYDVAPRSTRVIDPVVPLDGRELTAAHLNGADAIITNPPWTRDLLHALIARWVPLSVCWLLFDAAWKHTGQAVELMRAYCTDFVPCPRLIWIPGTTQASKDDCGWYRFDRAKSPRQATKFWPLGQGPYVRLISGKNSMGYAACQ